MKTKWIRRYLDLAYYVSEWSKDPSTKVGAVIVTPGNVPVSFGFNGFPRGCDDSPERYANKEYKYRHVIHAETNVILNARVPVAGCYLFVTHYPCNHCAGLIVQSGISQVHTHEQKDRWCLQDTMEVLESGNVQLSVHPLEIIK